MKFVLTFSTAGAINILLFWLMIQMLTVDQTGKWVRTTDAQFFDFIRRRAKEEVIPRAARKTPKMPEPDVVQPLAEPMQRQPNEPVADLRALPLPVQSLKLDIPLSSRIDVGTGPALPSVVSSGSSKTGVFAGAKNSKGYGSGSLANIMMADELTTISRVEPDYPHKLRYRRIEGKVVVEFTVTKEGHVTDAVVVSSKPSGAFDRAALRAIRRWQFMAPKNDNGQSVPVRARQIFEFTLRR